MSPSPPPPGSSRPLTPEDLGIDPTAVEILVGRIYVRDRAMAVRIENIVLAESMRGRQSLLGMIETLIATARGGGMKGLVIEGLSPGNTILVKILVRRHGAILTPQRTIVISRPLE